MDKLGSVQARPAKVASGFASGRALNIKWRMDHARGVALGPPRSDWPDRAACRARPAQPAFAGYISSDRGELSGDRRTGRFAQYFAPDRGAAVAGLGAKCDVGSRAAWPDLRAAHFGRPAADRTGLTFFRRCPDAAWRSYRSGTAVDPDPACLGRQGAIGRGRPRRGADPVVRPDPGRGGGADGKIQLAAEAYRIRAAGAGAGAGGAGRRGRPGREPRADAAARRSLIGAHRGHQFSQRADQRAHTGGSASRTRDRLDAKSRRTRSADAESHRRRDRKLVRW